MPAASIMSDTTPIAPTAEPRGFTKEWGVLIGFGLFVACAFVGFRYWSEYQADQPIAAQYRGFIAHLAANSAKANDYQQA